MLNIHRIIKCNKAQEQIYKVPQTILTITVRIYRKIFLGPKRLLKTQILEKKAIFTVKKILWAFILVFSSKTNLKGRFLRVQQVFSHLLRKLEITSVTPRRLF